MTDKLFITNRTNKPMLAVITNNDTGQDVLTRELLPGTNELYMQDLLKGVYLIHLEDADHVVIYEQQMVRD